MTRTKIALTVAAFVAVVAGAAPAARAQIPVTDVANLIAEHATALKTAAILIEHLHAARAAPDANQQPAPDAPAASTRRRFAGLQAFLSQGQFTYAMLQGDLSSIGYNIAAVNRGFDRCSRSRRRSGATPSTPTSATTTTAGTPRSRRPRKRPSAPSPRSAPSTPTTARWPTSSVSRTASSTGQVRLLQLINQQLALIHKDLGSVVQNLATTGRVLTNWSAGAVGRADDGPRAIAAPPRRLHQPRPGAARPQPLP